MGYTVECPSCCCDCNCGIKITAGANASCTSGTKFKIYLRVDGELFEDGPSDFPLIEKTYTKNPGEICAWWNEVDTSSGQAFQSSIHNSSGSSHEVSPTTGTIQVEKCLSGCTMATGASNIDATILSYMHQNILGTEEGLIECTSIKLKSGGWTGAELLGMDTVVGDFATDHPNDNINAFSFGELTPARFNALCVLYEFSPGAGQTNPGFVTFDRIDCFADYESAGGATPDASGFVIIGVDNGVDAPRCELISCGNPQSQFNRNCGAEHVTDDVEDQSGHTPNLCYTTECACPTMSMARKVNQNRKEALVNSKIRKRKCCGK